MRVIPPSYEQPHPFATHDVDEQEWLTFLDNVHEAGALTDKDRHRATNISILNLIPVVNMIISHGIRTYFKSQKTASVIQVIDIWNHHYFRPRKLEILLLRGVTKMNAVDKPIGNLHTPDPVDASGLEGAYMEAIARPKTIYDVERYRGQQGDDKDLTFRLFVVPIAS
ncbi:hypothetical protein BDQ17DRAFT_1356127 [Cyathus striatus]|nr:hypothetical protein BDQ17DRAFT_1356127 [Cyathus striatus]